MVFRMLSRFALPQRLPRCKTPWSGARCGFRVEAASHSCRDLLWDRHKPGLLPRAGQTHPNQAQCGLGLLWGHFGLLLSLSVIALSQGCLCSLIQPSRQQELELAQ